MADKTKWIAESQAELAELCDVSLATVSHWARSGMPGKPGRYDLRKIIPWLRTDGPCVHTRQKSDDDDPLMADGESPGLERYRQAKAAHAELDFAERQGELIARGKVKTLLGRWASILRRMGERISKRFGNDAAMMVNDSLRECGAVAKHEIGGPGTTDDSAD